MAQLPHWVNHRLRSLLSRLRVYDFTPPTHYCIFLVDSAVLAELEQFLTGSVTGDYFLLVYEEEVLLLLLRGDIYGKDIVSC